MDSISINHQLKIAVNKLVRAYCDPFCDDITSFVDSINQIHATAAQNGLMYALDKNGIDKAVRAGMSVTGEDSPEKFIQILNVFPFIAQGTQKAWVTSLGDEVYKAWVGALLKSIDFSNHNDPRLMLTYELKDCVEYAVIKKDVDVFTQAIQLIEWAFGDNTPNIRYMEIFMADLMGILSGLPVHPEIDAVMAEFLAEVSSYSFSDSDIPAMSLKRLEKLDSEGYAKTAEVVFMYYTLIPDDPHHLCRIKLKSGHTYNDEMLNKLITLDTQGIRLDLAPALVLYKLAQGQDEGYSLIFQNLKNKDDDNLLSILVDVLKHQDQVTPPFIAFLSELIEASQNEQPLIKAVIEHGWGDYLKQQMKTEPRLKRHILGHEMGL